MNIRERIEDLLKEIETELQNCSDPERKIQLINRYDSLISKLLQFERLSKQKRGGSRVKEIRISWASEHEE